MIENDFHAFQALFEKETGQKISLEESRDCLQSLADMLRLIYKPIRKKDYEKCTKNPSAI